MGPWESSGTPKNSELDCRGQKTLPWGVFYTVGKVLKRRCRKWPGMNHLNISNTSYVRKKGRKSNWQFDSRPLKVGNQPDPDVCRWGAMHHLDLLWNNLGVKLGEIVENYKTLLFSKFQKKRICFVRVMRLTRSQVTGWNPLEGFTKSSCEKLRLGGTLPASNSRKG
jgi:hypothetical protein